MSWYDPRSWAGNAAEAVTDRLSDQLHSVVEHFKKNPHQLAAAMVVVGGAISSGFGAKRYGELYAEKMIKQTEE